jgi:large subunit ribosomal protein L19
MERVMAKKSAEKSAATKTTTDLIRRVTLDRAAVGKKKLPDFQTGDTVGVYVKVKEGEKERVQLYQGIVIKVQGSGAGRSFTVRKMASGVGVERTFPLLSPVIDRLEVISRGKVRRARLFYLRGLKGRSARLEAEAYFGEGGAVGAADQAADGATAEAAAPKAPKAPKKDKKAASAKK